MHFIDLKSQQALIKNELMARLFAVLDHGQYVMGPEIEELEERLAAFVGVDYCISMSSGTDALLAALMALGIGVGDEVITTAFSFIATAETIALLGATPVFVDVDPATYNINVDLIATAITNRTKAILPVSLYGQCYDVDGLDGIAQNHGLPIIEDGAQSFGAQFHGRRSCGVSTIGCTSFFPSKPLGCYGDGGACFTQDENLATRLRQIRNHGQDRRYHHARLGFNGRLDTLQAAVLLAKLDLFDSEIEKRITIGHRYSELFLAGGARESGSETKGLLVPHIKDQYRSVYAQYTIQVDDRAALIAALDLKGIPTAVHYPLALDQQPVFKTVRSQCPLPVSHQLAQRVVSLPMHPYLSEHDQCRIVDAVLHSSMIMA